jgi:hypothetical protein
MNIEIARLGNLVSGLLANSLLPYVISPNHLTALQSGGLIVGMLPNARGGIT